MMNKIIVSNNKISSDCLDVSINNNEIVFNKSGEYLLEYTQGGNYNITFTIKNDVKLIESSYDLELDINNKYIIDGGYLKLVKFYNNKKVIENIDIDLCSKGSKIDYYFSNICRMEERYNININHKCKETISNIQNKSIALKNSILKFIINSNVVKESVKSILEQNTRIVTMGECDASISPNMYIDLNDVTAKHGSVIGAFKEDVIFYLMSKGINYNDTIKLLIKGYIMSNMDVDAYNRIKIMEIIDTYWR